MRGVSRLNSAALSNVTAMSLARFLLTAEAHPTYTGLLTMGQVPGAAGADVEAPIHRSLAEGQRATSVVVEVTDVFFRRVGAVDVACVTSLFQFSSARGASCLVS